MFCTASPGMIPEVPDSKGGLIMEQKKLKVLLITGIVTNEHDPRMIPMLRLLLESTGRFTVKVTEEFRGATEETIEGYDLLFINYDGKESVETPYVGLGEQSERLISDFARRGGGVVIYHSSFIHGDPALPEEFDRLVGCHLDMFKVGRKTVNISGRIDLIEDAHEIMKGCPPFFLAQQEDFFVGQEWLPDVPVTVLATTYDDIRYYTDPRLVQEHRKAEFEHVGNLEELPGMNQDTPVAWVHEYGEGRVFTVSIGHGPDTLRCPPFVGMLARGCEWAASGEVTIPYPDLDGWNRTKCWPYYLNLHMQEFSRYASF